jgi:hypothetical protein
MRKRSDGRKGRRRSYSRRAHILIRNHYDPALDITRDHNGFVHLASNKPLLRDYSVATRFAIANLNSRRGSPPKLSRDSRKPSGRSSEIQTRSSPVENQCGVKSVATNIMPAGTRDDAFRSCRRRETSSWIGTLNGRERTKSPRSHDIWALELPHRRDLLVRSVPRPFLRDPTSDYGQSATNQAADHPCDQRLPRPQMRCVPDRVASVTARLTPRPYPQ